MSKGTLTAVTMTTQSGTPVSGQISADKKSWKPASPLDRATTYKVATEATDSAGLVAHRERLVHHGLPGEQLHRQLHA